MGLSIQTLSDILADTLATLHFRTKVDAAGVKFVIGSPPADLELHTTNLPTDVLKRMAPGTTTFSDEPGLDSAHGLIDVWMLGFDRVRGIAMDEDGIGMAVTAFVENAAYFPRPGDDLWEKFAERYVVKARSLGNMDAMGKGLPERFVEEVCKYIQTLAG